MAPFASPLLAFVVVLLLIAVLTVKFRLNPFLTLFSSAVIYGLIAGVPPESVVGTATRGRAPSSPSLARWSLPVR